MRFEKVSESQYLKDFEDLVYSDKGGIPIVDILNGKAKYTSGFESLEFNNLIDIYNDIKLPMRATKNSAGYDFFAPYDFTLCPGDTIKISTGIRVKLEGDKFLMCAPRSGHGFKARIQLDNTIGIIDADYYNSSNEGHIMLKLTNDSHTGECIKVKKGAGMMQAIILQYLTVEDDEQNTKRDGGFGSTDGNIRT